MRKVLPLFAVCILPFAGCGPSGPLKYDVQGTVTWNGKELPEGDIIVESLEASADQSAGKIVNGAFKFQATAGKKKVRIFASRDTGEFDKVMNTKIREMYIPERYNHETKLEETIAANNDNRFKFDLTEKEK